jgi:hypothetical protein
MNSPEAFPVSQSLVGNMKAKGRRREATVEEERPPQSSIISKAKKTDRTDAAEVKDHESSGRLRSRLHVHDFRTRMADPDMLLSDAVLSEYRSRHSK